jgi:hypothetical protein
MEGDDRDSNETIGTGGIVVLLTMRRYPVILSGAYDID